MLTQENLKEVLNYNPETGVFTWKKRVFDTPRAGKIWNARFSGKKAGGLSGVYLKIGINKKQYFTHRLVFLYMTGKFPPNEVDHINEIKIDNRFVNLRLATRAENQANVKRISSNNSGYKGVHFNKNDRKWISQIAYKGNRTHLGSYDSPEEAHAAYCQAADKFHGEFKNYG